MKKTLITLTAVLIVGFMAASAFAWGQGNGFNNGCRGKGQGRAMLSNLTADQQAELKQLRQQYIDDTYETRAAMMAKHQQVRMLLETSSPDKNKLTTLSDEIMDMKKALADKRIDFVLKAKKISPELNLSAFRNCGRGGKGGFGKGGQGHRPCGNGQGQPVQE
ncbi:MAG: periplasmic heavy metal sensor [Desulfobacter sp.]|nr:periplasmic heavy metal sensor [Desulfobacter sp.]